MKKNSDDFPYVHVFTPGYLQSINMKRCRASVHESGRGCNFHQCLRDKNLLPHDGKLFCKRHHPPSIKALDDKVRKCTYAGHTFGPCLARLKKDDIGTWCANCRKYHVAALRNAKVDAYDRVVRLLTDVATPPKLPFTHAIIKAMRLHGVYGMPSTKKGKQ